MLEAAQLAIGCIEDGALDPHVVLERRCRQQFDAQIVGEHVGEVQAQLGVTAHGRFAAQVGAGEAAAINLDAGGIGLRVDGDGAGTDEDIAGLVGLGNRGSDGEGQQRGSEQ